MVKRDKIDTILIIEDDSKLLQFATWVLELEGYPVLQAQDGYEGLRLVRERRVALVLLDLRLPGLDGWSVLKEIKRSPELAALPVIVFSASAGAQQLKRVLKMGAADYLTKPISAPSLGEAVNRICRPKG